VCEQNAVLIAESNSQRPSTDTGQFLSQLHPISILPTCFSKIARTVLFLPPQPKNNRLPTDFPAKILYEFLVSTVRVKCLLSAV
jgi:hypothetical protein